MVPVLKWEDDDNTGGPVLRVGLPLAKVVTVAERDLAFEHIKFAVVTRHCTEAVTPSGELPKVRSRCSVEGVVTTLTFWVPLSRVTSEELLTETLKELGAKIEDTVVVL